MNHFLALALGLVLSSPIALPGAQRDSYRVTASAELGVLRGSNVFGLSLSEFVPSLGTDLTVESELEWPLNFTMAMTELRLSSGDPKGSGSWSLVLSAARSIDDPRGTMNDSDYLSVQSLRIPRTKFIYTESTTRGHATIADAAVHWTPAADGFVDHPWAVFLGYRHEHYDLDALGAQGWYLDLETQQQKPTSLPDTILGAAFESHHMLPYLGASLHLQPSEAATIQLQGRLMGFFSHETDDHAYRKKIGHGSARGYGVMLTTKPTWNIHSRTDGTFRVTLGAHLELQHLKSTTGVLKQSYYGDDPGLPGDQTGVPIPNSKFLNRSTRFLATAFVAAHFN